MFLEATAERRLTMRLETMSSDDHSTRGHSKRSPYCLTREGEGPDIDTENEKKNTWLGSSTQALRLATRHLAGDRDAASSSDIESSEIQRYGGSPVQLDRVSWGNGEGWVRVMYRSGGRWCTDRDGTIDRPQRQHRW